MGTFFKTISILLLALLIITGCSEASVGYPEKPIVSTSKESPFNKSHQEIASFEYSYGGFNGGYWEYHIETADNTIKFVAKGSNGVPLAIDSVIDNKSLRELEEIIITNNISSWNSFSESDNTILDGDGFKLKIKYTDGTEISANGYHMEPEGYAQGSKALTVFLDEMAKQAIIDLHEGMDYGPIGSFYMAMGEGNSIQTYMLKNRDGATTLARADKFETLSIQENLIKVSAENMVELKNIVDENNLNMWDSFYEKDDNPANDIFFRMEITYENGVEIHAEGYGRAPKNFAVVSNELEAFFGNLIDHN